MAEKKIGAKIVIDGESEFRANLNSAKTALNNFDSELKLVTASFKNNANSLEALRAKQQVYIKLQEEQRNKVSLLAEMQEKAIRKLEDEQSTLTSLGQKREQLNNALEEAKNTYGENSEEVQNLTKELEEVNKQYTAQERVVQKTGDKVNNYQTQLNNAETELTELNDEISQNERYLREAENSADGCATSIDEYGNEVSDATDKTSVFCDVLKAELLSSAIKEGIKAIAEGIKKIATAAVETGSSFEASMSQVAATMGITTDEIANGSKAYETLNKAAQDCGKSTMFSASQSAEALNYLALAGYDAEKAAATLPKVLNLAAAGGLDLAYASDLVTDSMAALGLETSELDNYIDEMAKTSQKSNTSVAQLGEATLVCAGTVSLTGQSLETMNTALGVLANNGIKGAEGGTHLRNMLLSLSAPTDTASSVIEELGLRVEDSSGNMRDLNDIMIDLNNALDGMGDTEKAKYISKIFNKTDIAAVNAMLKSTNGEYKNLNSQIKDCSGAAQAMADTLNDNLKGKVTILQSALEGLGITAYNLFDDDMKGAVDSATDAVGRLQDSIDNGDLGVSLRNMSEALGEFAENAIGAAETALPVLIDGLTWVLDNSDLIISGIAGIAAANLEMNVVAPAVTAVTTAWNAYKTANEGATVSQWLLNTAMNANPAGIIITALVGLTAAVSAYSVMNKDSAKYLDEVTKSTRDQVKAAKELNDQYKQGASDRAQKRSDMEAESKVCQNLVAELETLQEKTNLTAEEEQRRIMIIEELNSVMPELNLQLDEQTGLLNMSTEELEKNVEAMMALAVAEAAREDLTRIAKDQYEAEKQLAELEEQLVQQKETVAETQQKLNEENEKYNDNLEMQMASTGGYCDLLYQQQEAQKGLEDQIAATKDSISGFTNEYEKTLEYIDNTEQIYKAKSAVDDLGTAADGAGTEISAMSQEAIEAFNKMQEDLVKTIDSQMDLFTEFSSKCDLSADQIIKNMESQVTGIQQWSSNIQELADRGINQGLLQYLADMGPKGAGYVQAFTEATDEKLQEANELFAESMKIPEETANQIMKAYEKEGENFGEGYIFGIKHKENEILKISDELPKSAIEVWRKAQKSHSPSEETRDIGKDFGEGFILGVSDKREKIMTLIKTITSEMLTRSKEGVPDKYKNVGIQITEGLRLGIESGKSQVLESIRSMCEETIQSAKDALDIHSPSGEMEYVGEMTGEGYIKGYESSMEGIDEIVEDALPDVQKLYGGIAETHTVINALKTEYDKAMSEISDNKSLEQTSEALKKFGDAALSLGVNIGTMSKETLEAYDKMFNEVSGNINSQMNLFSEYKVESKISTDELLHNMQSQVTGVMQWANDIDSLANKGINQGLLQYLADMGPQGAGYVQAFTQMTDQELQKANELFQVSLMLPDATAANIISSYTKAGLNAAKGLGDGITSGTEEVVGASEDLGEESLDAVETTLDEHSPSRKTRKMGEYFDEGLKLGISENKEKILTVIKVITSEMLTRTKEGIPENYRNIGIQITEGLRSGIEAGRSAVIEAMRALCMETIQTAKSTLDINSPSKKFEYLGEMSGQGYISGWEQTMQNIDSIIMDTMPDLPSGAANNIAGAQAITNMQFPDALMSKMEQQNANILDTCGKMYNMMMQYMPGMANMQMVTDTGVLIGELIPGIDAEFGNMESDKERGVY